MLEFIIGLVVASLCVYGIYWAVRGFDDQPEHQPTAERPERPEPQPEPEPQPGKPPRHKPE